MYGVSLTQAAGCADVQSPSLRNAYVGAERALSDDFIKILVNTTRDVSLGFDDTVDHRIQPPNPKNVDHAAAAAVAQVTPLSGDKLQTSDAPLRY